MTGVRLSAVDIAAATLAAAAGFLVWELAPSLTGQPLPWDAPWPFYSLVMGTAGFAIGQFSRGVWLCIAAAWAGQVVALIVLPLDRSANMLGVGAWWVLGILATGVGSLILWIGWALARLWRRKLAERKRAGGGAPDR